MIPSTSIWRSIRPYLSGLVRYMHISYLETKSEYQSTYLGILSIPLSTLIFTAILALVFHGGGASVPQQFFLYVLSGYIFWNFIAETIGGSTAIIQSKFEFAIHNNLTLAGLFGKLLVDRLFEYGLNLVLLLLAILVISPEKFGLNLLLFVPFIALAVMTSLALSYLTNLATIFFPDISPFIGTAVRFMFFVTPVFWVAGGGDPGIRHFLISVNPAAYYLGLSRQVFGIEPFEANTWLVALGISGLICVAGAIAYRKSESFVRNIK